MIQPFRASVSYVHGRPHDSQAELREAELGSWIPLEPLVRAVAPGRVAEIRAAFTEARGLVAAGAPNTRVLGAVAQLANRIARAGPERVPDAGALREAGVLAVLWNTWPAALAVLATALLGRRWLLLPALAAAAGAWLGLRGFWPWQVAVAVQLGCAAALLIAVARPCERFFRKRRRTWRGRR